MVDFLFMEGVAPLSKSLENLQIRRSSLGNIHHVGAIDIGTNSTHLVVASVDAELNTFSIDIAEKSPTRLGERNFDTGNLTEVAMERTLDTLKRFKELALGHQVEQLIVAATSAVRDAPNGRGFLSQIKDQLDINVELISGTEEARLIYLGVLSGMPFEDSPYLLVDIGGGSTELILADVNDAQALTSSRVGAVRLQRDFVKHDPIPAHRREFIKTFVQGSLEPAIGKILSRISAKQKPVMVATSGTAMAIGALISAKNSQNSLKLHGFKVSKGSLDEVISSLVDLTPDQRKLLPSISERRAEIIVPGALIMQTIMEMVNVKELVLSERALREGLVVDWMLRKGFLENRFTLQSSIRERTVLHQAKRFGVNNSRAQRVSKYALELYDKTKGLLHKDKGEGRDLLWAAAMLHSCGKHINNTAFHKHSWYLISHGELLGYSQSEHSMVAAIARYHRKSLPKKRHLAWQSLVMKEEKKIVLEMSLLLRLSTAICKRPDQVIDSISVTSKGKLINITLVPKDSIQNLSLELWSLNNCASIVKELTGIELIVLRA